jgi:hypothetical protein
MSRACDGIDYVEAADFQVYFESYGSEEDVDEDNLYIPYEEEYVSPEEVYYEDSEVEEWDVAAEKPGLWENIRKKKQREGKKYKPAKPGDPDRPDQKSWKKAQSETTDECPEATQNIDVNLKNRKNCVDHANYGPANPDLPNKEFWQKKAELFNVITDEAKTMRCAGCSAFIQTKEMLDCIKNGIDPDQDGGYAEDIIDQANLGYCELFDFKCAGTRTCDAWIVGGPVVGSYKYQDPKTGQVYEYKRKGIYKKDGRFLILTESEASEYQGRKVKLGKPFRTPDGPKKFSVYVKNDKGNVVKVNFGDPNMKIKKYLPEHRKSFRARHHCDTDPGPRWKARYWACRAW